MEIIIENSTDRFFPIRPVYKVTKVPRSESVGDEKHQRLQQGSTYDNKGKIKIYHNGRAFELLA